MYDYSTLVLFGVETDSQSIQAPSVFRRLVSEMEKTLGEGSVRLRCRGDVARPPRPKGGLLSESLVNRWVQALPNGLGSLEVFDAWGDGDPPARYGAIGVLSLVRTDPPGVYSAGVENYIVLAGRESAIRDVFSRFRAAARDIVNVLNVVSGFLEKDIPWDVRDGRLPSFFTNMIDGRAHDVPTQLARAGHWMSRSVSCLHKGNILLDAHCKVTPEEIPGSIVTKVERWGRHIYIEMAKNPEYDADFRRAAQAYFNMLSE